MEIKETGIFTARMNETLAGILLHNLIKNAYIHNLKNGQLLIELSSSGLVLKNTGSAHVLHSKQIFERFYQGTKKEGSTGLGLTLVKSICDMERLTVNYYFEDGFHCFEISG